MPSLFAISDLHLAFAFQRPMESFGPHWADHAAKIERSWRAVVRPEDIVLVAGDHSWALRPAEVGPDLDWLAGLPGRKVLIKGNHDYWWRRLRQVRRLLGSGGHAVAGDAIRLGPVAIGGTRWWTSPEVDWPQELAALSPEASAGHGRREPGQGRPPLSEEENEAVRERELAKLRASLTAMDPEAEIKVVMLHYPPLGSDGRSTTVTRLLSEARVDLCVFGHLHNLGPGARPGADCVLGGTRYVLSSCDWLGFQLIRLLEF
jgi:predicted phosphohydrolase